MLFNSIHDCQNSELNKNILKMIIVKVVEVSKLKGGAYYCYCAYVLGISRCSGFPISDAFKYSDIFVRFKTIRRKEIFVSTIGIQKENMG